MIDSAFPEYLILIPEAMNPDLNVSKQTKLGITYGNMLNKYLAELEYLKQRQVHRLRLVF